MSEIRRCPHCGAEVPGDAPKGVCPQCLLKLALGQTGDDSSATSPHIPGAKFTPLPPTELARLFPQLEILELVGQGGMGAVYKTRQPRLNRLVALKVLPAEVAHDPAFAERFTREAQALAQLSHPHVVAVHDFGQADGLYYFLMEFVDGVNLRQMLQAGKLQPRDALAVVPQICEALQFAHDEGIVHRDIKPENILIDKKGRVKIADFGLAKLLGRAPAATLTGPQQVMGTPHYMAPEQLEHPQEVDHRADIYSLGVVFYEMLTGELPLGRFAPPSHMAQMDVRLDEVVLRSLEKAPERRYQNASDVKTDVENISQSGRPAARSDQIVASSAASLGKFADVDLEDARGQVRGPAIGLLITGILHCLFFALVLGIAGWQLFSSYDAQGPVEPGAMPRLTDKLPMPEEKP